MMVIGEYIFVFFVLGPSSVLTPVHQNLEGERNILLICLFSLIIGLIHCIQDSRLKYMYTQVYSISHHKIFEVQDFISIILKVVHKNLKLK